MNGALGRTAPALLPVVSWLPLDEADLATPCSASRGSTWQDAPSSKEARGGDIPTVHEACARDVSSGQNAWRAQVTYSIEAPLSA